MNEDEFSDICIPLPQNTSISEQFAMVCAIKKIPCYAREDLREKLTEFVLTKTQEYLDKQGDSFVQKFVSSTTDEAEHCADSLATAFSTQHRGYAPSQTVDNDDLFSDVYQSLLHSSNPSDISELLSKEQTLARDVQKLIRERNWEIERLKKEHTSVVEKTVRDLENDQDVADRASRHFERIHLVEGNYASQLSSVMDCQWREYRNFVLKLHEDQIIRKDSSDTSAQSSPQKKHRNPRAENPRLQTESFNTGGRMDESFTIYLGAQMKTMHNLRLSAMDPLSLCRRGFFAGSSIDDSRRLQMALSLYSSQFNGLVLLVDSRPNHHLNFQTDFSKACEQSTELHFDCLEKQLELVEKEVVRANHWRSSNSKSASHTSSSASSENLNTGDVYVTRHSNLSQVHVVFHLVVDDALKSQDVNSRHPCINGLRNVIRLCSKFGGTTISLPLLLIDKMTEDLTVQWCLKRAELVFKCLKGFLMEGAALGGTCSGNFGSGHHLFYNVQFFLPPEISGDVFSQITEMLPTIYHLVNPVMEKL